MKNIIIKLVSIYFVTSSFYANAQTVYPDHFDGEIYLKIKENVPFSFNESSDVVNIQKELPFLNPFLLEYNVDDVKSTFYFSKSEILMRTFRIYFANSSLVDQFIDELQDLEQVEYAEKVPIDRTGHTPNDLDKLFGIPLQQDELEHINAEQAWDWNRGSASVVIAIVDDAVDIDHEDLTTKVVSSRDVADGDNNPRDTNPNVVLDHGTHVAGIAAAATNNGKGIASIGYDCSIMAIKATPDNSTTGNLNSGYTGITWAVANGADIINCSWGSQNSFSQTNQNVIDNADLNGVIVVAAAGNHGSSAILYPAGYDHVIAVANIDDDNDEKASSSAFGTWVDVSAPGESIYSCLPGNNYGNKNGTSMASPMVAGLMGLVKDEFFAYNHKDVAYAVISRSVNINSENPSYVGQLGLGRINAEAAVSLTCYGSINLGAGNYSTLHTESSGTITSSNTIPASPPKYDHSVMFDAAVLVNLKPGFKALPGSNFKAFIDGCLGSVKETNPTIRVNDLSINNTINVYPNPFQNQTNIELQITEEEELVTVEVFDLVGKKVAVLADNQRMNQGMHKLVFESGQHAGNIFLCRIQIGEKSFVEKIVKMD